MNGLEVQYQSRLIRIRQEKIINSCCCAEEDMYTVRIGGKEIKELKEMKEGKEIEMVEDNRASMVSNDV